MTLIVSMVVLVSYSSDLFWRQFLIILYQCTTDLFWIRPSCPSCHIHTNILHSVGFDTPPPPPILNLLSFFQWIFSSLPWGWSCPVWKQLILDLSNSTMGTVLPSVETTFLELPNSVTGTVLASLVTTDLRSSKLSVKVFVLNELRLKFSIFQCSACF